MEELTSAEILKISKSLIADTRLKHKLSHIDKHRWFTTVPKYTVFRKKYSELYHGIIYGSVTDENFYMLVRMINERQKIRDGKKTLEKATAVISDTLADAFDFNLK